jgi:HK97 gp10 family phage protein
MAYRSRIPRVAALLPIRAAEAARLGAELVERRAKDRVPVRSGALRDAIHVEATGLGEFTVVAGDDEDVFYGHIVEHGGARTSAQPFLIPAGEETRKDLVKLGIRALRTL